MSKAPLMVSVIIPCYNEEETIGGCIESLLAQSYKPLEIIVIDDASTDKTPEIVGRYQVKFLRFDENKGPAFARNFGFKHAKGDIIVFCEADAFYPPKYIEKLVTPLLKGTDASISCPRRVLNKKGLISEYIEKRFYAACELTKANRRPIMGAWAFRREVLENVGLFDENLRVGEDRDLVERLKRRGYKIEVVFDNEWHHKEPKTLKEFAKFHFWRSVVGKKFRERWGLEPKGFKKLIFIGRNIAAIILPIYPVLAIFHNIIWLIIFFGVFFAESMFPIIYDRELRLTFKLALKDRDYKLALAMPFICWVEIRTRALGIFYAMLKGE